MTTSITDAQQDYKDFCLEASTSPEIMATFKRNPVYNRVVEHVTAEQGRRYYQKIAETGRAFDEETIRFIRYNDVIGNPRQIETELFGEISPTTLRYVHVACQMERIFGEDFMNSNLDIVEIGGGYGGQCLILDAMYGFKSYTIIDLDEVIELQKAYLGRGMVNFVPYSQLEYVWPDLCVSNFAFSECTREVQDEYIEAVLNRSWRGFITSNQMLGYTAAQLTKLMDGVSEPEEVNTSVEGQTHLITWR